MPGREVITLFPAENCPRPARRICQIAAFALEPVDTNSSIFRVHGGKADERQSRSPVPEAAGSVALLVLANSRFARICQFLLQWAVDARDLRVFTSLRYPTVIVLASPGGRRPDDAKQMTGISVVYLTTVPLEAAIPRSCQRNMSEYASSVKVKRSDCTMVMSLATPYLDCDDRVCWRFTLSSVCCRHVSKACTTPA